MDLFLWISNKKGRRKVMLRKMIGVVVVVVDCRRQRGCCCFPQVLRLQILFITPKSVAFLSHELKYINTWASFTSTLSAGTSLVGLRVSFE